MSKTINQLSAVDTLTGGDLMAIFQTSNGDARKSSLTLLLEWIQSAWSYPSTLKVEPLATIVALVPTGAEVIIPTTGDSYHIALGGSGTISTSKIALPGTANSSDKQEVSMTATSEITQMQFTVGAGAFIIGGGFQGTFAIGSFARFKYDLTTLTWYRIG